MSEENTFKISGVGIDTHRIGKLLKKSDLEGFTYVHTNPIAGNESYLRDAITNDHILISTVDFIDQIETIIPRHLLELEKTKLDLLLIDANCKIEENVDSLNNLIIAGLVDEIGISNPETPERIEELRNRISQLKYVSLNICPLNFPYNVIKYCHDNDIKILGFNAFGGKINYPRLIESFTVPYLLAFSGVYSNVVFLSSGRLDILDSETEYLSDLINKEYGMEYNMNQDVFKLPKEPKQAIYTSLKLSDDLCIPYNTADLIFSHQEIKFGLGKVNLSIPSENEEDNLTLAVSDFYKEFAGGPEDNPTLANTTTLLRYRILDLARIEYPEIDGWSIFCTPIDPQVFVISGVRKIKERKILKAKETVEQVNYIAYYDGTRLIFQNLKNALKTE